MLKKKLAVVVPMAMAGLSLVAMSIAHAEDKPDVKKPVAAASKPVTAVRNGMLVVKDPVTGQLRAPTADEAAALTAAPAANSATAGATASEAPKVIPGPGGGVGVKLDDSTRVYSVAKRNADGTVSLSEATGAQAAQRVVTTPTDSRKGIDAQGAKANESK